MDQKHLFAGSESGNFVDALIEAHAALTVKRFLAACFGWRWVISEGRREE
jgi:hypothetical protein